MSKLEIKQLLPELKKLVTQLSEDLLNRVIADDAINMGLKEAFAQVCKDGRTAQAYEVWLEDFLDQVAVAWVLACVFVRFMEDNGLIDECWLAGESDRRRLADDTHTLYFREHPRESDREYLQSVFREVGKIPAAVDLFAEGKTPLWAVAPSGDAAMKLLKFWREIDPETGNLKRPFQVESGDTRFLGDLYQDLSERAKKKFALLQTPVFVEEFILDRTLTPAIAEFGLEKVRMIDPTCGSGHFLLGGFARLFTLWIKQEKNEIKAAQKALGGVWGVDINPFAVAIARFRLIVAAVQACGIKRLKQAPGWTIHLASGDSLLFGKRPHIGGERLAIGQPRNLFEVSPLYAVEDPKALQHILGQGYHVVVGNPPYITVKDKAQNEAYRNLYSTCHRKYSLAAPFAQRFWELAIQQGEAVGGCGYVGQITANSFMKREFGKKLIEEFFPKIDLTHVVDTSGAYIPGHGTPTVILLGRSRKPTSGTVRAVQGIKGEPATPENPSQGSVWQSIVNQIDIANAQDEFTSTADVARATFANHPWSIGGGGASELKEQLEETATSQLSNHVLTIGFGAILGEDDAFSFPKETRHRVRVADQYVRPLIQGDHLRDWNVDWSLMTIFPYSDDITLCTDESILRHFWPCRTILSNRPDFSKRTYAEAGRPHWEFHQIPTDRYQTPLTIAFAEIASHNHFILDRGGKVFNRTAPIIKLPVNATAEEHLALIGLLNSSTACFWMKQVSHQKQMMGGDGIRISSRAKVPYQFAGTRLLELPTPDSFLHGPLRDRIQRLSAQLDLHFQEIASLTAASAIRLGVSEGETRVQDLFRKFEERRFALRSSMVFLQEEIDFTTYVIFDLVDESLLSSQFEWPNVQMNVGMRPFEILQQRSLDDFPVPSDIPTEWPEELRALWRNRMDAIRRSKDLSLIEDDHYKRRWLGRQGLFNHTARQDELKSACKIWLLERLESTNFSKDTPELTTTAHIADTASSDNDFLRIATLYRGRSDFDIAALVAELVGSEVIPFLPILRYKPSGQRKRDVWVRTWELQRQQDAGKAVSEIPVPPKYDTADYLNSDFWRLRGKLDVPKERWISYPHCSTESDPTLVITWAGWNHIQQATALVSYYDARKREGWSAERLTPLLAGLDQLIPWIHQWHPEIDPEYGETAGQSFQHLLESDAHELGLTLDGIRNWTPPAKQPKANPKKAKG
jgi:hypothetical protein